jgi:hypothetical protein
MSTAAIVLCMACACPTNKYAMHWQCGEYWYKSAKVIEEFKHPNRRIK